jgi:hypothetical protein
VALSSRRTAHDTRVHNWTAFQRSAAVVRHPCGSWTGPVRLRNPWGGGTRGAILCEAMWRQSVAFRGPELHATGTLPPSRAWTTPANALSRWRDWRSPHSDTKDGRLRNTELVRCCGTATRVRRITRSLVESFAVHLPDPTVHTLESRCRGKHDFDTRPLTRHRSDDYPPTGHLHTLAHAP